MEKRNELEKKFSKAVNEHKIQDGFIKVTDNPIGSLTSEQKVSLNRKANELFNNGDIEGARRIFQTTGYSDGLTRVGYYYVNHNESLKALKFYYLAHNKRDSEPIYENIANVISNIIKND